MEGDRDRTLAAFLQPRRPVAALRPRPAPFSILHWDRRCGRPCPWRRSLADRGRAAPPTSPRPAPRARRLRCRSRSERRSRAPACCANRPRCNSSPRHCCRRCRRNPAPDTGTGSSPPGTDRRWHWACSVDPCTCAGRSCRDARCRAIPTPHPCCRCRRRAVQSPAAGRCRFRRAPSRVDLAAELISWAHRPLVNNARRGSG